MNFRKVAACAVCAFFLCLPGTASAVPLADVNGVWHIDVPTTLKKSTDAELKKALADDANVLGNLTLTIDAKMNIMTLSLPGGHPESIGFAVAEEKGQVLLLTTEDGSKMHLEVTGKNTLMMGAVPESGKGVEADVHFKR